MERIIASALLSIAALFGWAAFTAPTAHADAGDYIFALEHSAFAHYSGQKSTYIDMGYRVCADVSAGWSRPAIVNAMVNRRDTQVDYVAANDLFDKAMDWLCDGT